MERLGTEYGGWWVPANTINSKSICYCVGAGEDVSFDCDLITRYGCNVFTFDPTPRAINHVRNLFEETNSDRLMPINNAANHFYSITKEQIDKLHFYSYGIWSKNEKKRFYVPMNKKDVSHSILNLQRTMEYFESDCFTIKHIMNELNHDYITLLKLDIEGAEYEVIDSIICDNMKPLILCIEFDEGNNPIDGDYLTRIQVSISSLLDFGFVPIYRDGWNVTFTSGNKKK